jgi:hypothetical protein
LKKLLKFWGNGNFRIKTKGGGFIKYYGSYDGNSMKLAMPSLEDYADIIKLIKKVKILSLAFLQRKIWKIYFEFGNFLHLQPKYFEFKNIKTMQKFSIMT